MYGKLDRTPRYHRLCTEHFPRRCLRRCLEDFLVFSIYPPDTLYIPSIYPLFTLQIRSTLFEHIRSHYSVKNSNQSSPPRSSEPKISHFEPIKSPIPSL